MKTISCIVHIALLKARADASLISNSLLRKVVCVATFLSLFLTSAFDTAAQDIVIDNPSLEGKVTVSGRLPKPWLVISQSPDQQPGIAGFSFPASAGDFYIGAVLTNDWQELFGQNLRSPLKAGKTYTLSVDLASTTFYTRDICNGSFAIYGCNPGEQPELLWESGNFNHTTWKRYAPVFTPKKDYRQIIFGPNSIFKCKERSYAAVLVDNFSPTIREVPQVSVTTTTTCKNASTGEASVKLLSAHNPVTYLWMPGGQTTSHVSGLSAGTYKLTVTALNGASVTVDVIIKETDLKSVVNIIISKCNGDNENGIALTTSGGIPPYRYYLNDDTQPSYTPAFNQLHPGTYRVMVKDEQGCEDPYEKIDLKEPPKLQLLSVTTKAASCSETTDGRIFLQANGGTQPYAYRLEGTEWQMDSILGHLDKGRYYFQVKDKNDCEVKGSADVDKNIRQCAVFVPTAFSPNGDGQNDLFRAKVHDDVTDYKLEVYTRWGQTVFSTNSPDGAWDGLFKGKMLPAAAYVWVLLYTDSKQQARKQTGTVMLIQ